jgi:integrase
MSTSAPPSRVGSFPDPGAQALRAVRTFGTTTRELLALVGWLAEEAVTHVAMESTGSYWKPVHNILEDAFELLVVNAAHIKAVPGRKTDVRDAEWIADLLCHGLLRASFVPSRPERELRELTRYRSALIRERASEVNRVQKVLEGANIKLASVASEVAGVSGLAILRALIAGEEDPGVLAALARGRMRAKRVALEEALEGRMGAHQRFTLGVMLRHIGELDRNIEDVSAEIERRLAPHEPAIARLVTIPGIGRRTAETLWFVDEGLLSCDPFRRSRRRAALNPLLPSEETPTKSATLDDIRALETGCAGDRPLDLRDRAVVSILKTTAARNSSVRLLQLEDLDFERALIRFRRGKGGKTLDVALQPETRAALSAYLERGRPLLVEQAGTATEADPGWLFVSACQSDGVQPLSMNAVSLMLTRRYHAGGGSLRTFGSHRIRHATATLLVNNGMPLEEVSRYLGHSSTDVTRRYARQTPDALGRRAAEALERAGLVAS